jgi:hypothetical protein
MGSSTVEGYAELAKANRKLFKGTVIAHLTSNMFPPVHPDFHPAAFDAIALANAGDWGVTLELSNGRTVTVSETIEQLHLGAFLD